MKRSKKSKLALSILTQELRRMEEKEIQETMGGNGVLKGGTGTFTDPYIIAASFYHLQGLDNTTVSNLQSAASQFSSSGVVLQNEKYYRFEVNVVAISQQNYDNFAAFQELNDIRTTPYGEKQSWANLIKMSSATAMNGSDFVIGNANADTITYFEGSGSAHYSQLNAAGAMYNSNQYQQQVFAHEMLHTMGLGHDDNGGNIMNTNVGMSNYNITFTQLRAIIDNIGQGASNYGASNGFGGRVLSIGSF